MRRSLLRGSLLLTAVAVACTFTACTAAPSDDPTGTWGSQDEGHPNLTFADDQTVSGNDGCNSLAGTWQLEGDVVTLGPLASTMMFCEGVDTWLSMAWTAQVVGSTLHVFDEDGSEIGTLSRG